VQLLSPGLLLTGLNSAVTLFLAMQVGVCCVCVCVRACMCAWTVLRLCALGWVCLSMMGWCGAQIGGGTCPRREPQTSPRDGRGTLALTPLHPFSRPAPL
jgi:hypothetical protein